MNPRGLRLLVCLLGLDGASIKFRGQPEDRNRDKNTRPDAYYPGLELTVAAVLLVTVLSDLPICATLE